MIKPEGALATEWCYHQRKCSTSFLVFVNLALTGAYYAVMSGSLALANASAVLDLSAHG